MDPLSLLFGAADFVKILALLSIVSFILFKMLSPLREKLADRFGLSWVKSCLVFNFVLIFVCLAAMYFYFVAVGSAIAAPVDEDIQLSLAEQAAVYLGDLARVLIGAIILALLLMVFEFAASLAIEAQAKKKKRSLFLRQFIGVAVSCAIFLALFLFVFGWAPLGFFVYIFYGGVNAPPVALAMLWP